MRGYYDGPSKNNEIDLNQSINNRNEQRMDLKVHNLHVRVCHLINITCREVNSFLK